MDGLTPVATIYDPTVTLQAEDELQVFKVAITAKVNSESDGSLSQMPLFIALATFIGGVICLFLAMRLRNSAALEDSDERI